MSFFDKEKFDILLIHVFCIIRNILNKSNLQDYHLSLKYLIFIEHSAKKSVEKLDRVIKILWENGLINSHVLNEDEFNIWTLNTFIPFQRSCAELQHIQIASFSPLNFTKNTNLSLKQLNPEKLKNFNQCPLLVAAPKANPFVRYNTVNGSIQYSGLDINIITHISQKLNFRIVYKPSGDHGLILRNGTVTGSAGLVCSFSCDRFSFCNWMSSFHDSIIIKIFW